MFAFLKRFLRPQNSLLTFLLLTCLVRYLNALNPLTRSTCSLLAVLKLFVLPSSQFLHIFSFPFFSSLSLSLFHLRREYPCDHYTSVITVTLLMTGCPRVEVHATALQLLQILDKRFFGSSVGTLHSDNEKGMNSPTSIHN